MFDRSNRVSVFYSPLQLNLDVLVCAILWLCLLFVIFHLIRKRTKLIQNFGIVTLVIMIVFVLIRAFLPLNFPFTRYVYIDSELWWQVLYFFKEYPLFTISGVSWEVTILGLLLTVWLVGSVVSLLLFFVRVRLALKSLRKDIAPPSPEEQEILDQVRREFGKPSPVKLYRAMVTSPLTFGYFRPTILIPQGKIYSDDELYCVFLHELTHYHHKDAWIKLVVQILCCLLWWNPLVYVFQKDVEQTVEIH